MHYGFQILSHQNVFLTLIIIRIIINNWAPVITDYNWVPNQHIRMISEGSCDTEDWSNGSWKFSFASQE